MTTLNSRAEASASVSPLPGANPSRSGLAAALRRHWPEYAIEAALLGAFMVSACVFSVVLEHPGSPVRQSIADGFARRALMGLAMGATAIAIIYSPWGRRSGAHINPATTLTFFRLGRVEGADAVLYAAAQFVGALAGIGLMAWLLPAAVRHPAVNFAATLPGPAGAGAAFAAEVAITFVLITVVLAMTNAPRWNRLTGLAVGACVALFITFEAPLSGMSMNPARTFGSASGAMRWDHLWIYFTAPPLGMLLAAEARLRTRGLHSILCAKLHHENDQRCIFRCGYPVCAPALPAKGAHRG
ncbi:MAG TPA: aquaporin [Thermoanaerobaculia bacterium]